MGEDDLLFFPSFRERHAESLAEYDNRRRDWIHARLAARGAPGSIRENNRLAVEKRRKEKDMALNYEIINNPSEIVRFKETSMTTAEENLRAALQMYASQAALAGRFHGQQPPVGTVLRWVKKYDPRKPGEIVLNTDDREQVRFTINAPQEYIYVAFRAPNDAWYVTGTRGGSRMETDWDKLLKEIGDAECQLVSGWTDVPVPEKPAEEMLDPTVWAKRFFPNKDEKEGAE